MPRRPAPSAALIVELRALICRVADGPAESRRPRVGPGSWDLDNVLVSGGGHKEDYLAVLRAARQVVVAAEATAELAVHHALREGADFAELGAAEGVTRQAARQRYERTTARRAVRFVGGPRDGTEGVAIGAQREIRRGEWAGPWERRQSWGGSSGGPSVISVYRAKYGSPGVFEFVHYENSETGKVVANWGRRPRVEELARYWFTDSTTVLAEARVLSPKIKTPASRVELPLLEPLRAALLARLGGRLSSALPNNEQPEDYDED